MGDIHHGGFQLLVQTGKVQTHLHAQLGIQVRERFVEHKDPRITHDGAANGHTLALTAGKLLRFAIQKVGKLQRFGHHLDLMADLIFRHLIDLQAVAHVFGHRHMWVERIGLKHHRHAAVGGGNVVHHLVTNQHFPFANVLQSGNHAQHCRFTAAGRTDKDGKLTVFNLKIHVVQGYGVAKAFGDIPQLYVRHLYSPSKPPRMYYV
ncbi:Uncharacterised protein [Enterobacter ludwigii]|nr:Uncharacterised protein [Enterobacter ludwigii]